MPVRRGAGRRPRSRTSRLAGCSRPSRLPAEAERRLRHGRDDGQRPCLAVARAEVLRRAGWDVEAHGLIGAPRAAVMVGEEAHRPCSARLRLVGLGAARAARPGRSRGPHAARRAPGGARRGGRAGDRLRPGRQRQQRRVSTRSRTSSRSAVPPGRGCTSTAPSGSGPRRARRSRSSPPGTPARTPGPSTPTSG